MALDPLLRDLWALIDTWRTRQRHAAEPSAAVLARCIRELAERVPIPPAPTQRHHTEAYIKQQQAKHREEKRNIAEALRVRARARRTKDWADWMSLDPSARRKAREREKRARQRIHRLYGPSAPFQSLLPKRPAG